MSEFSNPLPKAKLRAPLSPCKQPGPNSTFILYSDGSSSAGPALLESSKVFYTQQGHYDIQCLPYPQSQDGVQCVALHQGWSVPCGWAYRPVGLTVKAHLP